MHNVQENPVPYIMLICVMERPTGSPLTHLSIFPAYNVTFMVMTTSVCRYMPDCYLNSTFTLSICSISIAGKPQSLCCWKTPGEADILTLILRRSRTGTVWFYTSTSNKRAARPKLYTMSLTRDLELMYSRFTLVRISIKFRHRASSI